jgi:hypothetical protein
MNNYSIDWNIKNNANISFVINLNKISNIPIKKIKTNKFVDKKLGGTG